MEQDFSRGHLEELLKERTGEYKMYPTERVWNSIYHRLHTRRKWHFIGGGTFALMILAGVFVLMQDNSPHASKAISFTVATQKTAPSGAQVHPSLKTNSLLVNWNKIAAAGHSSFKSLSLTRTNGDLLLSKNVLEAYNRENKIVGEDYERTAGTVNEYARTTPENFHTDRDPSIHADAVSASDADKLAEASNQSGRLLPLRMISNDSLLTARWDASTSALESGKKALLPASAPSRYSWLFHFQPSVSFRTLKSKAVIKTSNYGFIVFDNNGYDINKLVDQRPSVGFELGTDLLYSLNSRIKLKVGLQFNYSRYLAQATSAAPRPALISLGGPGTGGIPAQSFPSTTSYINDVSPAGNNAYATWIPDQRAELSVPLGAELEVLHNQSFSWNIAGTFQPTYILNARAFLLSADYKSYVQDPNLLRRWNMNVAAETFLRFNRGKMQLQVGPQIRYQLMPSFIDSYPIKEHLYDIGFKIGITRTFR